MDKLNYVTAIRERSLCRFILGLGARLLSQLVIEMRLLHMRRKGAVIGVCSVIGKRAVFSGYDNLHIGEHCSIQGGFFDTRSQITIHDRVIIGDAVSVLTCSHDIDSPEWKFCSYGLEVDDYVWIATGAKILPQCRRIGKGAVIGAYAVVSRDVPPMAVVVGNPARIVRYRKCVHDQIVPELFLGGDLRAYWAARMGRH